MNIRRSTVLTTASLGILFCLSGAFSPAYADAPVFCVTNDTELASALKNAQSSPLSIHVKQGTYHLLQTVWSAPASPSAKAKFSDGSGLFGGFLGDTCSSRNVGVNNTIITDPSTAPKAEFEMLGDATIEGITFKLPTMLEIFAESTLPNKSQLNIRRNVFTDSTNGIPGPLEITWDQAPSRSGTIRLVNNLIHDNFSTFSAGNSGAVFFQINDGSPNVELINNTIVDNTGQLGGVGFVANDPISIFAYNNILYGNAAADIATWTGNQLTITDNVIGTHTYAEPPVSSGNTNSDPKLDGNFRPIESPVSNVINSGTASVSGGLPSTDLSGRARQIGSAPDRGAFESTINNSPIQSVTTTADSGVGSLRSAIASANTGTGTLIVFNLGNSCPNVIQLQTPLPQITASMAIAGYSQDGSSQNDLATGDDAVICVILDGATNTIADGLYVSAGAPDSVQAQISGLAFSGFTHSAFSMYGGSAHTFTGSHIGGNVGGVTLSAVKNGVVIGPGVHDVKIGDGDFDSNVSERNIIGGATDGGIVLDGATGVRVAAHDNMIANNYIGVGWSNAGSGSFTDRGNGSAGIVVAGDGNQIKYNYIEFNGGYGIDFTSTGANNNSTLDNNIGYLNSYIDQGSANQGGILFENGAHDNFVNGDEIWFNVGAGIRVISGQGNRFFNPALWKNSGLGIDLAAEGVTANDNDTASQPADYANRGLNFPVITAAKGGHFYGTFTGTLTTAPGTYTIELHLSSTCDASGYGQAEFELGSTPVTVPAAGADGQSTGTFSFQNLSGKSFANAPFITATASDAAKNTSELSKCFPYVDDTIFADGFDT
jgi:hypothetical protein